MRFLLVSCSLVAAYAQGIVTDGATRADWPHYGGTQLSWRYSALDQINTGNVKKLAPAWVFQTGDYTDALQSTPIVVSGVLYLSSPRSQVYALDAATGQLLWQFKYPLPPASAAAGILTRPQNRGVAVGDGYVFLGTYDNYVVAIDAKTGHEAWKVNIDDSKHCGCIISGAPLVVKDKVIVGGTGGDGAHRGYLTALNTRTGRLAWRFYTIPGPGEKGNETWKGDSWKYGGGATWMTGSFDPALNLVYWGTGNAASDFYPGDRVTGSGRDIDLYTASVVALDADTGKLKWHYQEIPNDLWDFDSAYECILLDREVKGQMRKLLVHMNKSGLMFVLDRVTGQFLGAYSTVEVQTWISGITETGELVGRREPKVGSSTNVCPSPAGAKSWNQMAYSPRTGMIYTPNMELCFDVTANRQEPREGSFYSGGSWALKLAPNRTTYSHIDGWDAVTGKRMWTYAYKYVLLASILTTAGDLVFTGDPEGNFFALDARNGNKLWTFQTGAGHRGSAVSYSVNGRQYIATPTGWGTITGPMTSALFPEGDTWRGGSALMVFALPEESK